MNETDPQMHAAQSETDAFAEWQKRWPARDDLRRYVVDWLGKTTANEKTVATYRKRADEVRRGHTGLDEAETKSTYRMTRFAILYTLSEQIEVALRDSAKADRERRYADASALIDQAIRYKARIDEIRDMKMPEGLAAPKSKRKMVAKLPDDFADIYFLAAKGTPLEDALASMGVIGGRPSEYDPQHGVTVSREGECLKFRVAGSKVKGENQGLLWRELTVKPGSACARHLFERCAGGPITIQVESSDWLTQHVRRHCKKLTGLDDLTPYVWRNRFCAQMKATWSGDKEAIAIAMGHASTESQSRYGYYGGRSKMVFADRVLEVKGAKSRAEIRCKAAKMELPK